MWILRPDFVSYSMARLGTPVSGILREFGRDWLDPSVRQLHTLFPYVLFHAISRTWEQVMKSGPTNFQFDFGGCVDGSISDIVN
jgi:hypothetical protein